MTLGRSFSVEDGILIGTDEAGRRVSESVGAELGPGELITASCGLLRARVSALCNTALSTAAYNEQK